MSSFGQRYFLPQYWLKCWVLEFKAKGLTPRAFVLIYKLGQEEVEIKIMHQTLAKTWGLTPRVWVFLYRLSLEEIEIHVMAKTLGPGV